MAKAVSVGNTGACPSSLTTVKKKLTEKCNKTKRDTFSGGLVCVTSPLVVSEYMGFKLTSNPRFCVKKTMWGPEVRVPSSS